MPETFDALLFDFDGVLVDSEPVHYQCWREILRPFNIDLSWERYVANCIGISDRTMLEFLAKEAEPPIAIDDLWKEYPRKRALFRERMLDAQPIDGKTLRLLEDAGRHWPMAVVTSSGESEVKPILQACRALDFFKTCVYGGDVKSLKPHPEPYLLAAGRLRAERPLVIEDSAAGIASGEAAGFAVLRVPEPKLMIDLVRTKLGIQVPARA